MIKKLFLRQPVFVKLRLNGRVETRVGLCLDMVGLLRADHVTTVDIVVRFLDVSKIFRYLDQSNETRADDDDVFKRF